jgi:hypothetical protein
MKKNTLSISFLKSKLVLLNILISLVGFSQVNISSLPYSSGNINFDNYDPSSLANANSTLPVGWSISGAANYKGRGAGTGTSGGFYAFGTTTDFSLGALRSGSNEYTYQVSYTNNSGATINSLTIFWNYEQWRYANASGWNCSGTGALSGNSVLASKNFTGTSSGTTGSVSTTAINSFTLENLSIANGQSFGISWVTFDVTGSDNVISIDDFNLSANSYPTWNGTAWSNGTGPDTTTQATIAGVYSTTTNGTFTAKNVVIQSGLLTINSGTTLTVQDGIENQLTESAFVIENNANLIQTNVLATNIGNANVKTNSAPMVRLDYTAWSSPVAGQNLKTFSPQTLDARFYTYDAPSDAYVVVAAPASTNFTSGVGYLLRSPNDSDLTIPVAYAGQFIGIPFNGTRTTPVTIGYNLVGNPYPSKLDALNFLANVTNNGLGITTLHFWTHTVAAVGGVYPTNNYASFNSMGGTAAAAGGATPNGTISVGQGFFVDINTAGNATFLNTMRSTAVSTQFFKSASVVATPSDKHRFWLNLTSPTTANNQILIGYTADSSNDFDAKYDAPLFGNTASVIYSKVADKKLAIQGRINFATTDVLPLGLQATEASQFTISLADFDGLFVNQNIYLRDNVLNTIQDLKVGSYTFNAAQGEFASRFEVVFENSALSTNTSEFTDSSVLVIKNNNGISIETGNNTIQTVNVFDIRGRLLQTKGNINATNVTLNNVAAVNQVLIVKITNTNNQTVSKKMVN